MNARFLIACGLLNMLPLGAVSAEQFARFSYQGAAHYGRLSGDQLRIIEGDLFSNNTATNTVVNRSDVQWLPPTTPQKVFAVGMNFASHRASKANAPPPLFLKLPSSLAGHKQTVTLPEDAENVHFEGEMVLVIGKRAKQVSEEKAAAYIFGITIGNDLSERSWQRKDLQWLRAKASDGFGPVGPVIATGLDYNNVILTTRVNGKTLQQENTKHMIHSPAKVVSYLSRYFTLEPGDLIFMGTPGKTRALKRGDTVSVNIEGVGTLTNSIE